MANFDSPQMVRFLTLLSELPDGRLVAPKRAIEQVAIELNCSKGAASQTVGRARLAGCVGVDAKRRIGTNAVWILKEGRDYLASAIAGVSSNGSAPKVRKVEKKSKSTPQPEAKPALPEEAMQQIRISIESAFSNALADLRAEIVEFRSQIEELQKPEDPTPVPEQPTAQADTGSLELRSQLESATDQISRLQTELSYQEGEKETFRDRAVQAERKQSLAEVARDSAREECGRVQAENEGLREELRKKPGYVVDPKRAELESKLGEARRRISELETAFQRSQEEKEIEVTRSRNLRNELTRLRLGSE